jgi:Glu-tRNA(Gln) amidotransferase subunit E-like FAD-binding protein
MLNRAIEETVSGSIGEVTDFMAKCDADMERLRNDFVTSSAQIAKDITQKQHMVDQLSDQQAEHIGQVTKDCDMIQKRVEELLKKFAQQKKTLLANQEKHIALFREDMLSEVKAAVTCRKRESSKRMVQKLVTLLDEL